MNWADPEERREYNRKWRLANPERCKEHNRKWRIAHADHVREYNREYRRLHGEQINKRRRDARKKNIPAGDGTITVDLNKRDSWTRKAYSTEDWLLHDELGMGYDEMNKYRRMKEYE